jgi:NAD-dependent SIR2 family protein deacetylase
MPSQPSGMHTKRCMSCQFEAPADDEKWGSSSHPSLGMLTQCPECGSTDIQSID